MVYPYNQNQSNQTEIRKLQGIHGNSTYTIVLPKEFVSILNLEKGDYLKCRVTESSIDNRKSRSLTKKRGCV